MCACTVRSPFNCALDIQSLSTSEYMLRKAVAHPSSPTFNLDWRVLETSSSRERLIGSKMSKRKTFFNRHIGQKIVIKPRLYCTAWKYSLVLFTVFFKAEHYTDNAPALLGGHYSSGLHFFLSPPPCSLHTHAHTWVTQVSGPFPHGRNCRGCRM